MANPTTGMFQTLVAAASQASQNLQYANAFVDAIYWDYQPVVATPYTSLNVLIPNVNEGNVVDIQAGPIQPVDYTYNQVSISLNKHFSNSFIIKSWDQIRTPADLERLFVRPNFEALLRKVNRALAALATTGNFSTNAAVTGATSQEHARADITTGWTELVNLGVPVDDAANMFLLTSPTAYGKMLSDTTYFQQYVVGEAASQAAQRDGRLVTQYGTKVRYDQHLAPASGTAQTGLLMHRYAIAGVTANPPSNDAPHVEETIVMLKDYLPVQLQMSYSMQDQGWVVHLHCYWGLLVARPEMGVILNTAS